EHPRRRFAGIKQTLRGSARSGRLLAKGRRKQHGTHFSLKAMPRDKFTSEFIVTAIAKNKLDLVLRIQHFQIFRVKGVALSRVWALHVDDFHHSLRNLFQGPLTTGFKKHRVARVEESLQERDQFTLLKHRLTAGDFHQTTIRTEALDFGENLLGSHAMATREGIFTVTPHTAEIASGETDEYTRHSCVRRFALD